MSQPHHDTLKKEQTQVCSWVNDLWESEVVPRLPENVEEEAHRLKAFQKVRQVSSASDLLRGLLAYVLCAPSFARLGAWAVLIGLADISKDAWRKRLRLASAWLQWLLGELLAVPAAPNWLQGHTAGQVLVIDATRLRQPGGTGDDWRLHTAYDLRAARLCQVTVTDRHVGESLLHYRLRPGDIVLTDNGYGYRRSIALVVKLQAHTVVRITPSSFPLEDKQGQPIDVLLWLAKLGAGIGSVQSLRCWCRWEEQRYEVRLIARRLSEETTRRVRQQKIRKAQKDGRTASEATLLLAGWLLLVTTLPQEEWSNQDVLCLYRARWQIELLYKRMKQMLRLEQLRSVHVESVQAIIRLLLVAWVLQEEVASSLRALLSEALSPVIEAESGTAAESTSESESGTAAEITTESGTAAESEPENLSGPISSWVLTGLCLDTLRQQVQGQWSEARLRACLPQLRRFLISSPRQRVHQETAIRRWLARPRQGIPIVLEDAA